MYIGLNRLPPLSVNPIERRVRIKFRGNQGSHKIKETWLWSGSKMRGNMLVEIANSWPTMTEYFFEQPTQPCGQKNTCKLTLYWWFIFLVNNWTAFVLVSRQSPCSQYKHGCLRRWKRSDLWEVLIWICADVYKHALVSILKLLSSHPFGIRSYFPK